MAYAFAAQRALHPLIWATWNRLPLIVPEIESEAHRLVGAEAARLGCDVLAVGGVENHVHLLVKLPPSLCVSEAAKKIKATSVAGVEP
jgi:REP element-mobilizing transposase RayT